MSQDLYYALAVAGLVVITTLTRSFFFLTDDPWPLPDWAERGLRYAPLAAIAAVVLPSVLLTQGQWPLTWQDPRFVATPLAMLWAWKRKDMLGTIAIGMAVMVGLKVGLGW
jgi:branched-subunit amino acid transport protein